MTTQFFRHFLMVSEIRTVAFLVALVALFIVVGAMQRRKVSFSARVLIAMAMGLALGLIIQIAAGFPDEPMKTTFIAETTKWYGLVGNGFIDLIRMLVIPLIMVSIVHVIVNMQGADLGRLARNTIAVTMLMVVVAASVGLVLGLLFRLGVGSEAVEGASR
jgi:L-cystine uptake protein TcyP (sodium:dicarboxylate symporter family)